MRKLKIIEHISLDGVIQVTGSLEDNFLYNDWTAPCRTSTGLATLLEEGHAVRHTG